MRTEEEMVAEVRACGRQMTSILAQHARGDITDSACNSALGSVHRQRYWTGQELIELRTSVA